ncbi:MAG: sulfatase-like hydrolase/transferase, partial [Verrucomicrobiota bacterium]
MNCRPTALLRIVMLAAMMRGGGTLQAADFTNIVLVMADDQGWYETGYNGHPYVKTPVLDAMAGQALRFDRFYAAGPNCSPTRGSIMTGRNSIRFGCLDPSYTLRLEEVMLPRILKEHGYRTGHFGKWHLGPVKSASPVTPAACGFEEYISHDNFFELNPMLSRNGAPPEQRTGESSEIVVSDALEFIGRVKTENKPFLAVVWFGSPHSPYSGLPEDVALYGDVPTDEMRNRFAEITAMDRAIGQLRSGLAALGLTTNTMLWYCSDNGVPSGTTPMGPLRGSKGTIFENGLRVPALLEWPAVVRTPAITSVPVVTSDMMPTILDFLGIPYPDPARKLDGVSIKALIENPVGAPARSKPIGFWRRSTSAYLTGAFWFPNKADLKGDMPTAANLTGIQFENHVYPVAKTTGFPGNAAWLEYPLKYVIDSGNDLLFNVQSDSLDAT